MFRFIKTHRSLMESIRSNASVNGSILRDVQVGDVYLQLVKAGSKFIVKYGKGSLPSKVKFKRIFIGSEDTATKKLNTMWERLVKKL